MDTADRIIADFAEESAGYPIAWGKSDCAMWSAALLKRLHGVDLAKGWRRYRTERGAKRVLGKLGLPGAVRKAVKAHSWHRRDPADVRVGDLGLVWLDEGPACVVCMRVATTDAPPTWIGRVPYGVAVFSRQLDCAWGP